MRRLGLLAAVLSFAPNALGATERLALIVGNNRGESLNPLRYAEDDAAKMAQVLTDLGSVAPEDLVLLRGASLASLLTAFAGVKSKVQTRHGDPRGRVMLLFYFSGHSDGEALELGRDRLGFSQLRRELAKTGADVRVAIIDSCRSGAVLAAKGATPGPAFDIRLSDDLPNEGVVFLTSSAPDEDALESRELRGSFFTTNLVSGLRGAADLSGDDRVTLGEAYRYAYTRTVAATAGTIYGAQHPGYSYQLSGMGELVLTELTAPSSALLLPRDFERALVSEASRDEVLAEFPIGAPRRVALRGGEYRVLVWRRGRPYAAKVALAQGSKRELTWAELIPLVAGSAVAPKGDGDSAALAAAVTLFDQYDQEKAAAAFSALLVQNPSGSIAARAHVYLGVIALNAMQSDQAREDFREALLDDPLVELPSMVSPKAALAFGEVRRLLSQEVQELTPTSPPPAPAVPAAAVAAPPLVVATPAERAPPPTRGHWLSLGLGGVALAAGVVAVIGGAEVASYGGYVSGLNSGPPTAQSFSQYSSARSTAEAWNVGWVVAAGVGVAALASAILTW